MSDKCVFCDPAPGDVIEQSAHAFAVYSADAIKPGHIIVALREHVTSFEAMTDAQAADLFALARRTAALALGVAGAKKYYTLSIADMVPHFHLHLLPRMPGDAPIGAHVMGDAGWKGAVGAPVPAADRAAFIEKFKP